MQRLLATFVAIALLGAGCTLIERDRTPSPNQRPEAVLSGGPADGDPDVFYRVHFNWFGHDPDGRVVRFEWLLTNDEVTGPLIIDADIYARLSALGYTWTSTTAFQAQLVVSADQFPDLGAPADSIYWEPDPLRFHAQHSFFLRAFDDDGAVSALPAHRSFTATTLAPEVQITHPADLGLPGGDETVATVLRFRWTGWDSLQDGSVIEPDSSRFALFRRADLPLDEESGLLLTLPDSAWSPWRGWRDQDADGEAGGRQVLLRDLESIAGGGSAGFYQFFVQAKDEAGAVTSHFQDGVNLRRLRVVTSLAPQLRLLGTVCGLRVFQHSATLDLEAPAAVPVSFSWSGSAEDYGSEIAAYRFGWDILDPENDEEWSDWSLTATSTQADYPGGEHRLRVACRDLSGNITAVELVLQFTPITLERDLLVIDDYDNLAGEDPYQGWPLGDPATWGNYSLTNAEMETWWNALLADYGGYEPGIDHLRLTVAQPAPDLAQLGSYAPRDLGSEGVPRRPIGAQAPGGLRRSRRRSALSIRTCCRSGSRRAADCCSAARVRSTTCCPSPARWAIPPTNAASRSPSCATCA